jgi:hypothetical protein
MSDPPEDVGRVGRAGQTARTYLIPVTSQALVVAFFAGGCDQFREPRFQSGQMECQRGPLIRSKDKDRVSQPG